MRKTLRPVSSVQCTDSDGLNYTTKGRVVYQRKLYNDFCNDAGKLVEMICKRWIFGTYQASQIYTCQYGCNNGSCNRQPSIITTPTQPSQDLTQTIHDYNQTQAVKDFATTMYNEALKQGYTVPDATDSEYLNGTYCSINESNIQSDCLIGRLSMLVRSLFDMKELKDTDRNSLVAGKDYYRNIYVNNTKRYYLIHIPKSYSKDSLNGSPVIVDYHGWSTTGELEFFAFALYARVDQETTNPPIILTGTGNGCPELHSRYQSSWNSYNKEGFQGTGWADDISYTKAIIEDIKKFTKVDTKRIYATGISDGGLMAGRVGLELPEIFAAVAPVACILNRNVTTELSRLRPPVSIIGFSGLEDMYFYGVNCTYESNWTCISESQYNLTAPGQSAIMNYPAMYAIDAFGKFEKCNSSKEISLPNTVPAPMDNTTVLRYYYEGCRNNSGVEILKIVGGGHTWPGYMLQTNARYNEIRMATVPMILQASSTTQDISANDMIVEFFKAHPKP